MPIEPPEIPPATPAIRRNRRRKVPRAVHSRRYRRRFASPASRRSLTNCLAERPTSFRCADRKDRARLRLQPTDLPGPERGLKTGPIGHAGGDNVI